MASCHNDIEALVSAVESGLGLQPSVCGLLLKTATEKRAVQKKGRQTMSSEPSAFQSLQGGLNPTPEAYGSKLANRIVNATGKCHFF